MENGRLGVAHQTAPKYLRGDITRRLCASHASERDAVYTLGVPPLPLPNGIIELGVIFAPKY